MFNRFSTPFTHTTPINYQKVPLTKLSIVKIFPKAVVHTKNATFRGTLAPKMLFLGEECPEEP